MTEPYLIDNAGKKIEIPYYEIGDFAEQKVNEYINLNDKNKRQFDEFSEEYYYFKPYFDFLISNMGYKFMNPFISKVSQLTYIDGYFKDSSISLEPEIPLAKDRNYQIHHIDIDKVKTSIISPDGICFTALRNDKLYITHEKICKMLLVEKMIYDKNLYYEYMKCITCEENIFKYNIQAFFEHMGYVRVGIYEDETGFIVYDSYHLEDNIKGFLLSLEAFYPRLQFADQNIKRQESDVYEIRRL